MMVVRIYVGTYKKYSEGNIYGAWLNLQDYSGYNELMQAMRTLHKDEESPEFMFQDYECSEFIEDLGLINESYISSEIYDALEAIENSGLNEEVLEAYSYCSDIHGSDIHDVLAEIESRYRGKYAGDIDFVREFVEETGGISEQLPHYISIDWERSSRNFMYGYCSHRNHYFDRH